MAIETAETRTSLGRCDRTSELEAEELATAYEVFPGGALGGNALPDDIRFLAPYVLEHRILLTPEAELEGGTSAAIVAQAIERVVYTEKAQAG